MFKKTALFLHDGFLYNNDHFPPSGFHSISAGLQQYGSQEQLNDLHQMIALATKEKEAGFEASRKAYKTYKENYVKHLQFNPAAPNLSNIFH